MGVLGMIILWKANLGPTERDPTGWRERVSNTSYIFFHSLGKLLTIVKLDNAVLRAVSSRSDLTYS